MRKNTSISNKKAAKAMALALSAAMTVTGVTAGTNFSMTAEAAVTAEEKAEAEANVKAFVERMYTKALGRSAEAGGLKYWSDALLNHESDGASMAYGFLIEAPEFGNRKLNNDDFVEVLYQTFFDRAGDKTGKDYWLTQLAKGTTREKIIQGFVNSDEYGKLCVSYGISSGFMFENGKPANAGISNFVYRLYDKLLGRTPDAKGMRYWVEQVASGKMTIEQVATEQFIFSDEFQKLQKNMSDAAYVDTLYATFFDRAADTNGRTYWRLQLASGADRKKVVYGFSDSNEFRALLKKYGLNTNLKNKYTPVKETAKADDLAVKAYYWQGVGTKEYDAKGALLTTTQDQYDTNERYVGYKNYSYYDKSGYLMKELILTRDKNGVITTEKEDTYDFTTDGEKPIYSAATYYLKSSKVTTYKDGKITGIKEQKYDSKKQVIAEAVTTYENGVITGMTAKTFAPDFDGSKYLCFQEDRVYKNGLLATATETIYTKAFNTETQQMSSLYKSKQKVTNYAYNSDGTSKNTVSVESFYNPGVLEPAATSEYDITFTYTNGKLVEEKSYDKSADRLDYMMSYEYDSKGNMTKETRTVMKDGALYIPYYNVYTYNAAGDRTSATEYYTTDGTIDNAFRNEWTESTYKVFDNISMIMSSDTYRRVAGEYDKLTGTTPVFDGYEEGFKYDRDSKTGSALVYYFYDGTQENGYKKVLSYYTKYLSDSVKLDKATAAGQTATAKTEATFGANDVSMGYAETIYRSFSYVTER